ncbi:MAG: hypothetical protein V3W18_10650 [candidate division Zixibacteria bacterium]
MFNKQKTGFYLELVFIFGCLLLLEGVFAANGPTKNEVIGMLNRVDIDSLPLILKEKDLNIVDGYVDLIKDNAQLVDELVDFSDSSDVYNYLLFYSIRDSIIQSNYGFGDFNNLADQLLEYDSFFGISQDSSVVFSDSIFQKNYGKYIRSVRNIMCVFLELLNEFPRAGYVSIHKGGVLLLPIFGGQPTLGFFDIFISRISGSPPLLNDDLMMLNRKIVGIKYYEESYVLVFPFISNGKYKCDISISIHGRPR